MGLRHILWLACFAVSCARVGMPTGGAKDEQPPQWLKSTPEQGTIQFQGRELVLEFDEYVQVQNMNQQFFSSPALNSAPVFRVKKRSLIVQWDDTLKPQTTYRFYFGSGVVDVHENNPIKDLELVFSTGDYIDSARIAGSVTDAYSGQPLGDLTVMAWRDTLNDSIIASTKPDFVAKTNGSGRFDMQYLPQGVFRLLAIQDLNKDFKVQASERMAFAQTWVSASADSTAPVLVLRAYVPEADSLKVISKKLERNQLLTVGLNKACKACRIQGPFHLKTQFDKNGDTLSAWLPDFEPVDSLVFEVYNGEERVDQLAVYPSKSRKATPVPMGFEVLDQGQVRPGKQPRLQLKEPLAAGFDTVNVLGQLADSTTVMGRLVADSTNELVYAVDIPLQMGQSLALILPDSVLITRYGTPVKGDTLGVVMPTEEQLGRLLFAVEHGDSLPAFFELIDQNDQVVHRQDLKRGSSSIDLKYLVPGKYVVRVIADLDGNGQYTPGSYVGRRQPEPVYYFKGGVEVRANWEQELRWDPSVEADVK
ncbi:MAG TPA: Ig-like domain-containing protein [Luteibaculaceae bacterium]|nr:Ig-like domain-containing protein [Luteibaculaceae bacterium]